MPILSQVSSTANTAYQRFYSLPKLEKIAVIGVVAFAALALVAQFTSIGIPVTALLLGATCSAIAEFILTCLATKPEEKSVTQAKKVETELKVENEEVETQDPEFENADEVDTTSKTDATGDSSSSEPE